MTQNYNYQKKGFRTKAFVSCFNFSIFFLYNKIKTEC